MYIGTAFIKNLLKISCKYALTHDLHTLFYIIFILSKFCSSVASTDIEKISEKSIKNNINFFTIEY